MRGENLPYNEVSKCFEDEDDFFDILPNVFAKPMIKMLVFLER